MTRADWVDVYRGCTGHSTVLGWWVWVWLSIVWLMMVSVALLFTHEILKFYITDITSEAYVWNITN